jgi:hypothetical protein
MIVFVRIVILHRVRCHNPLPPAMVLYLDHSFLHVFESLQQNYYLLVFLFQLPLQNLHVSFRFVFVFCCRCDETLLRYAFLALLGRVVSTVFHLAKPEEVVEVAFDLFALVLLPFVPR